VLRTGRAELARIDGLIGSFATRNVGGARFTQGMSTLPADLLMQEFVLGGGRAVLEGRRSIAQQWRAASRALELARREPWIMLGADSQFSGAEAVRLSEAAAVAELAVQFTVPEGTIRQWAHLADTLERSLPATWDRCLEGLVAAQNATEAARTVIDLPEPAHAEFDRAMADLAVRLTPPKFRLKARAIRERLHPTTPDERHAAAREQRRVWVEHDRDGMSWFGAYLPTDLAHAAMTRIDSHAFELGKAPDERRTTAQLRADVLGDLLTIGLTTSVSLGLTIPALSLLDRDSGLPILDGVGPIPRDIAERLAGDATSFVRILTEPLTGSVVDMEGRTRRIPKAMRRWLRQRDRTCTFPGCNRPAMDADLDHTRDVQFGGSTAAGNLAHLCRKHHTLKHKTNWRYVQEPAVAPGIAVTWTSPLGYTTGADPPPF
jgi:hypothetical protein